MSRGPGKVQRAILDLLHECATKGALSLGTSEIFREIFGLNFVERANEAQTRTGRRALRRLRAARLIKNAPRMKLDPLRLNPVRPQEKRWTLVTRPEIDKSWRNGYRQSADWREDEDFALRTQSLYDALTAHGSLNRQKSPLPAGERDRLRKLLGMMGSAFTGEQANAAAQADRIRQQFGLTWDELLKK